MCKILTLYVEIFSEVSAVEIFDFWLKVKKNFVSDFDDIMLYLSGIKIRLQPCTRFRSTANISRVIAKKLSFSGVFAENP